MARKIVVSRLSSLLTLSMLSLLSSVVDGSSGSMPEIASYARVSSNRDGSIDRSINQSKKDLNASNEMPISQSRNFHDSPIYVPSKSSSSARKLQNGEVIDHTLPRKYTTLDREAIVQLDAINSRKQAQKRFHPPASFEHVLAHSNAMRPKIETTDSKKPEFPVPSYATLPRDVYSTNYDYQSDGKTSPNDSPPQGSKDYSSGSTDTFSKIPDSYANPDEGSPKYPGYSSYEDKYPPKASDFPDNFERPSYADISFADHHDYPHDLIYDHPPDHLFHDHRTTTTEEPEMNDQRLSKRPYSYYYIGKKLWYLPLYFSIYFIIYIAALVLKSISRHKINFPANLAAAVADGRHFPYNPPGWIDLTKRVLDGIDLYNGIGKSRHDLS